MVQPNIPRDIWFQVARFLGEHTLSSLLEVNGVFFQLAMDARYREVTFESLDPIPVKLLQRLRDPNVSNRVRCFKINLCSDWILNTTNVPGLPSGISFQEAMTEVVLGFHNVTDYSIEWSDIPPSIVTPPLLTAAWNTFGSGLQKLSLTAEGFKSILTPSFTSKYLSELRIELTRSAIFDEALRTTLAPVINRHAPTLQLISIACYDDSRDFGDLFCSLHGVPNLQQLEILVDFHQCGLMNPRGVTRLLKDHTDVLRSVRLRPAMKHGTPWPEAEAALIEWMRANVSNSTVLGNLESLDLRIPVLSNESVLMGVYLQRSVETLTTLSILDHHLEYEQIEPLINIFSQTRKLKQLSLQAWTMSPQLVDLLATALPNLEVLNLSVRKIFSHGDHPPRLSPEDTDREMAAFEEEMRKRVFPGWKLYDVGMIRVGPDPFISRLMAASVPSIRSFFGQGDMLMRWGIGGSQAGGRYSGQ